METVRGDQLFTGEVRFEKKVGFYGAVPVAQRAGTAQVGIDTTSVVGTTFWGFATSTQGNALIAAVREMQAVLSTTGLMKGSA